MHIDNTVKSGNSTQRRTSGLFPDVTRKQWGFAAVSSALLIAIAFARAPFREIHDSLFVGDGFGYYIYLPSLFIDGDLDLSNQLAYQHDQPNQQWYEFVEATQRPGNCFQVGCAVLWTPFFLLAHGGVALFNAMGFNVRQDGFGFAYELPVYVGSFFYGLVGIYFTWRLLTKLYDQQIATLATLGITFCSALAAYLWLEPDMSHVPSMFLISALAYQLHAIYIDSSLDWRRWALVGLLIGLTVSVRATDVWVVIAAVAVGLACCRPAASTWAKIVTCVVVCTVFVVIGFVPQMLAWKSLYGGYLTRPPNVYTKFNWLSPDLVGFFVGAKRGIVAWTPVLAFSFVGLLSGWFRGPRFIRYLIPVVIVAIYFNSIIPNWWVGASFSERRTVDYSIIFAIGLAQFLAQLGSSRYRWWTAGCLFVLACFNWVLMMRYFSHDLPEYGHVTYANLYLETFTFPYRVATRLFS